MLAVFDANIKKKFVNFIWMLFHDDWYFSVYTNVNGLWTLRVEIHAKVSTKYIEIYINTSGEL